MTQLVLAAIAFAALHLLVSGTRLRDTLVARFGERVYRGLFALASAAVLGWLIVTYRDVRIPAPSPLYDYRAWAAVPNLLAFALVVLGLLTPGPTAVGSEKLLQREDPARGIHRITRHPFLWGVALWAAAHMLFNPEPPHLVFFGTFLLVALAGTFSIDAKRARRFGADWQRYAGRTSNVPFAAIVQGRNALALGELGWLKLLAAAAAFAAFAAYHVNLFGVLPGI